MRIVNPLNLSENIFLWIVKIVSKLSEDRCSD